MLLLILFVGYLASCAAQTTSSAFSTAGTSTTTPAPFTGVNPSSTVVTPTQSANNVVALFEAAVRSNQELNEVTLALVMNQIRQTILLIQPQANFSLTLKNITRV